MHVVEKTIIVTIGDRAVPFGVCTYTVEGKNFVFFIFFFSNLIAPLKLVTLIGERNCQSLVQERHLLEPSTQSLKLKLNGLKNLGIRVERLNSTGLLRGFTAAQGTIRNTTVSKRNVPGITLTVDFGYNLFRERINDRNTHAVQTTGNGISAAAEFTASVKNSHNDLDRGFMLGWMLIHGNTAAIILNAHATIGLNCNFNMTCVACERLIYGVIDHLVDQMV